MQVAQMMFLLLACSWITCAASGMTEAPVGEWKSPISSELIVSQSIRLGSPVIAHDGSLIWSEGRPKEGGRQVLVRRYNRLCIATYAPNARTSGLSDMATIWTLSSKVLGDADVFETLCVCAGVLMARLRTSCQILLSMQEQGYTNMGAGSMWLAKKLYTFPTSSKFLLLPI